MRSPSMRKKIFLIESSENSICPICGHSLKPRDHVNRIMKSSGNIVRWLCIRRLVCTNQSCHSMHRELPDILAPYKHFEADIITGVLDHLITPETKGFEDHPSESTMQQWRHWFMLNRGNVKIQRIPASGIYSRTSDIQCFTARQTSQGYL